MRNKKNGIQGSVTVEAALFLSVFIIGFTTILSYAAYARLESVTQYAVNETAKEISRYLYVLERLNLNAGLPTDENIGKIDDVIGNLSQLNSAVKDGYDNNIGNADLGPDSNIEDILSTVGSAGDDFRKIQAAAKEVEGSIKTLADNPAAILKSLLNLGLDTAARRVASRVLAPPICKTLCQKYIGENAHQKLESLGVIDGIDGLDFSMSSILFDGRTVTVSVVYRAQNVFPTLINQPHVVRQTASTAAWMFFDTSVSDIKVSTWSKPPTERGKEFVQKEKNANSDSAVQGGHGVDLYDPSTNTYTYLYSVNIFSTSYSNYQSGAGSGASAYSLKENAIRNLLNSKAREALKYTQDVPDELKRSDGSRVQTSGINPSTVIRIIVPNESIHKSSELNEIARQVEADNPGVKVEFTYQENAIGS